MYNEFLNDHGDEENEMDNKMERLRVVSPSRMAYEKKFEKYMISELEKMIHDKENPIFKREDFDLAITHPDKSYNK